MNHLLIDTNIVLDLLAKREAFYGAAAKIFTLADQNSIKLFINALTFANINYVLTRLKSAQESREILRKFKVLVHVLSLNDKIIELALNDRNFKDFEDGLQYYSAIENGIEVIVTRDLKDFKAAKIPVMTPDGFLIAIGDKNL